MYLNTMLDFKRIRRYYLSNQSERRSSSRIICSSTTIYLNWPLLINHLWLQLINKQPIMHSGYQSRWEYILPHVRQQSEKKMQAPYKNTGGHVVFTNYKMASCKLLLRSLGMPWISSILFSISRDFNASIFFQGLSFFNTFNQRRPARLPCNYSVQLRAGTVNDSFEIVRRLSKCVTEY